MTFLVLVRATVVEKAKTTFLDMSLGGDGMAAGTAAGEIQKEKSFFVSIAMPWLTNGNQRFLNIVKGPLCDHWCMNSLVDFAFVDENAAVKRIAKKIRDRRKRQRLSTSFTEHTRFRQVSLNCGKRMSARRKSFENGFDLLKILRVWLDRAKPWFVEISERSLAVIDAATNFFANA